MVQTIIFGKFCIRAGLTSFIDFAFIFQAAGTKLTDPGLSCTDIDGDQTSYAIQSGLHNDYFR